MIGRERLVFLRLAQALLPDERITPSVADRADELLSHTQGIIRIFIRFSLLLFEWGTFLFKTAGSIEHFGLLSARGQRHYIRFWMNHRRAVMRQIFQVLQILVIASTYDDPAASSRWVRPC